MNPDDFRDSPAGHLVPTIQGCMAFVPNPLPPDRVLDLAPMVPLISRANRALGELNGIGRTLQDPFLLIRPFMRTEAVASSRIEGTVTTQLELFILEVGADKVPTRSDTREVHNYVRALEFALKKLKELPVSLRLIREIHGVLMRDVSPHRGAHIVPGEFKRDQNWIGGRLIQNARFVPPPPKEAMEAMGQLERYIHDTTDDMPLIIKLALIHYQFETIHPFPDGNGRVGRLLLPLLLCERQEMSLPLLYLSTYFERHYDEYIDRMFDVSRAGFWEPWIEFFLKGVEDACQDAICRAGMIQDLHSRYRERIQGARASALLARIVDELFKVPAVTIPYVQLHLDISYNAAKNHVKKLVEYGILEPSTDENDRPKFFFANEIIQTLGDQSKTSVAAQ